MNTNRNVSNTAVRSNVVRGALFALTFFCLTIVATSLSAQTTYTWNQTGTASWATSTNWTPTRTTPATNDVLVFNNGATTVVTAVPAQTIGQLSVSGNTNVTLQAAVTATTLTIGGGTGTDLSVAAGSQLNVNTALAYTIALPTGTTGSVSGSINFTTGAHKLTSADASGVTFQNGSVFTSGTGVSGAPLGTVTNSIIFASGSTFVFVAGTNPFPATSFQTGSLFSNQGAGTPSFSGRTYANFEQKTASTTTVTGGTAVVMDNLTITQGTLNFNMTGTPGHTINGNISVASGATLNFNPLTAGTVNVKGNITNAGTLGFTPTVTGNVILNGSSAQSISNSGSLSVGNANETITVSNANGVSLLTPVTINNGSLALTTGNVSTGVNTLSIASAANIPRTNGYVIGNLKKTYAAASSKVFELGTANGYSPVTVNATTGTFPADLTATVAQTAQPNMTPATSLQRFWTLTPAPSGITGADLTFQYLAGDVQGNENIYKVYQVVGGTPTSFPGSTVNTGTHTGSLSGATGLAADWTLGEFVDVTPPTVVSVAVPANGTYGTGQNLDFTVNFSENVVVAGTPRIPITLNTGGTVFANYFSGTGSTALLFRYVVGSGVEDTDGITLGTALDLNGGTIKDLSGNDTVTTLNSVPSTTGILVDGIAPTAVSITRAGSTPTNASSADFTVTFSENIKASTVDASDFSLASSTVAGASITGVVVAGSTATVSVNTGSGDGVVDLDLIDNDSITDLAGNPLGGSGAGNGSLTNGETYSIDKTAPVVQSIVRANASPTNASSVDFTVTFSESVTGVASNDFAVVMSGVSGATIANVAGSGSTYTVTVNTGSGDGTLRVDFLGSAADGAGNGTGGFFTSGETYSIDKTAPSVVSSTRTGSASTSAQSVGFTVTFSESVTGVDAADFVLTTTGLTGTSITNVTGSGTTYTVTADTGTGNGTLRLDVVPGASIFDAAGNSAGAFTSGDVYTIDKSLPSVVSITRNGPNPTHNASVHFNVSFSTNVSGVDTSDFTLTTSGISGATVSNVSGSGSTYDITVSGISGDGTVRLDLVDNDSIIADSNSNPLGGSGAGNGNFNTGEVYTIDQTPPAVLSIVRANANPTTAATVHFTVTYSEVVTGVSAQDWSLTTSGVTGASVTATNGSGTTYDVTVNTGSGDGTIRLDVVTGGTVIDTAGNLLPAGFNSGEVYTIDRTSPTVQSIARANADPTSAASVAFTVTFSESVSGVDTSDFTLATSGVTGASITGVTGSGPYTVNVNTGSGSGTIGLNLVDDDTIADGTGNKLGGTGAGNGNFTGSVYTVQKAPLAPTSLAATSGLDSHVPLTWSAPNGASTYNIKRGPTTGSETTIASSVATTSYDDTTAVNGTTYFYVVSASNGQGEGPDSNEVSATPNPAAPAPGPVSIAVGDAKVILSWPAVVGATSYNVKRGTTTGSYGVVTNTLVPTFTDSTVTNGTTYFYVVTALSPAEGSASAEVSGTPNTPSVLGVVFSTVYGGGGNAGSTLKNDYMELFNRGTQTVSLAGWSVQYTSAAATTWAAANSPTALSGTIAPGHYYLVQEGPGAGGTVNLPTPDATGLIAMGATAGKVALVGNTTGLTGACPTGTFIADFVGYGPTATCSETSPTVVLTNTTAALRNNNGCTDTNNNNSDFTAGAPNPRNSASPVNVCGAVNNPPAITPPGNPIASVAQDAAPFTVNLTGSDDGGVYQWTATPGTGLQSVTVTGGQGTPTVTYTVTLTAGYSGTATFTASLSDGINAAVNQLVNIQVTGTGGNNPPLITPPANPITTVAQDPAPFTVNVSGTDDGGIFNWSATPGTGVASVNVTGGQGTATVTYTVTLNAGFNGTATFTASLSDNVNPTANQAVNINVLPAGATPNHVVISQLYGGGGNSGATYTNDFIELFNPTASPVSLAGWSVQYSSATNTGAFSGLQPIGGTIGPGEYYLISLASGGAVGSPLPLANVINNSGFNMSGTAGKVALVNTGTPVPGPCTATATDTDIVDLVGYGTTANCNEGGTNAPAPSNTTSDFRKNGGNTDTNVNGNDFLTGTPNPRRTTPIQEFGPAIVNTDPASNASAAPRDASMIITFTELVDVDPGWYNINCSVTGNHNDATFVEGAPDTWVIIPNANFTPAEQCSVTIFANSVHDRDTDDSAPGTDTLAADYTWTFTVSSGAAPPYPASVHLTMGMPSVCTTSLSSPNAYLMLKPENSICYNRDLGRPNWVSWHLTDEWFGSLARVDTFRPDPEVPPTWYRVLASDFFASGFDRGHMTPNADRDSQVPIVQATFLMSNMVAQAPDNNQGPWAALENDLRTTAGSTNELYIVSGPFGTGGTGSNGGTTNTVANGHVTVPASTWKCALVLPKASGDDVARVTASTRTLCVIMPNIQGIRNDDWHVYLKSVDQVEALTGYDLFSNVPPAIQNAIEAGLDGANPPGAADQSTSTNEDVAKSITLDAATPGGALTYTILTGPFHGGLTGTGANQTYTPAPDFNGTDTFTWRVNDGTNNSNTATMTITVAEVNDPPVAVDDSKSTTSNSPLIFASSDLTSNDSAGPANEAGQTLTVTAVTQTGSTHGTVSLTSGQITYTPTIGYTGPASFTYSVCDNGTTAGSAAPLCATATVNVTVSPAPPATHFSVTAPANVTNGVAFNITVTALDASNATATGYTGTAHFTSSSSGTLPSNYTFTGGDLGVHTFSVTLTSNGSRTVTATDTITPSITGTATTNVLSSVTHYSVTAPASTLQGTPFNVTVTALDASNAVVTSYTGTAHFTSSSAGTLPADYTFVSGDNGTHTFSVTLTATGTQTITATDTVTASITGTASTSVALVCPPGPAPTATASNSGPACVGNSVTLFSSGSGTVFSWTGPGGFTSNLQNPSGITVAGTYTVTVSSTGPCGGSAQASTTVVIDPLPAAAITSGGTACALSTGNNASIADAGVGATYTWSITNGTITSGITTRAIVYTAGASGNVHLSVTVGAVSGCGATGSADVAISSAPAISVQPVGQIVNPGNNATFTVTATGLNLHYQWFVHHPSGVILPVGTDSSSYTTNPEGNAWWFVRVSNSCGTVDSVSVDALVVTPRHRPTH